MRTKEIFEGRYTIYSDGRVWSNISNKFFKQYTNNSGYKFISPTINKKSYNRTIHRLVAEAFIPNPNNLPEVNHKDLIKINNNDWNLEWCTHRENHNHRFKSKHPGCHFRKGKYEAGIQHNKKRIYLGRFNTAQEASNAYISYCILHNLS